jgi:hypothetical protein
MLAGAVTDPGPWSRAEGGATGEAAAGAGGDTEATGRGVGFTVGADGEGEGLDLGAGVTALRASLPAGL